MQMAKTPDEAGRSDGGAGRGAIVATLLDVSVVDGLVTGCRCNVAEKRCACIADGGLTMKKCLENCPRLKMLLTVGAPFH